MIENPPDTPLVAAIYGELAHGCHGLPAKRAVLHVALTLTKPRNRPCELDTRAPNGGYFRGDWVQLQPSAKGRSACTLMRCLALIWDLTDRHALRCRN